MGYLVMGTYVKRSYSKTCPLCSVAFVCKKADRIYCDSCRQVRLNSLKRKRRAVNPQKYRAKDNAYNRRGYGEVMKSVKNNWRARRHGKSPLNVDVIRSIFFKDNYTCSYCLQRGGMLTIDHIQPLSRNGDNSENNLTTSCRSCNMSKGKKTLVEFLIYKSQESN